MFVRWIRWAIKRISYGPAELIGDSGWSLAKRADDKPGDVVGGVPEPGFSSKPER